MLLKVQDMNLEMCHECFGGVGLGVSACRRILEEQELQ